MKSFSSTFTKVFKVIPEISSYTHSLSINNNHIVSRVDWKLFLVGAVFLLLKYDTYDTVLPTANGYAEKII